MKARERAIVTSIFAVLILGWLGFLLHVSPRFAGSGMGAAFGISGAVMMFVPLIYAVAKRVRLFRERLTKHFSLQPWLSIHIYTGIVGALIALIHTGHKYTSPVGIALTAAMLLVVVTGYALRYLTPFVNVDLKDKLLLLQTARGDLDSAWGVLEKSAAERTALPKARLFAAGLGSIGIPLPLNEAASRVTLLADSVADLEYSIRTDELLRRWFRRALSFHIALSITMYVLLAAHITSGIYFGLRWLQ
jgi:hypothetical protein